jgi:hypothetical protein
MMVYRVDVNKNESSNTQERVIVIRGQQENCIQACREVLRIMYEDATINPLSTNGAYRPHFFKI